MKKIAFILIATLMLFSCSTQDNCVVKAGEHYSSYKLIPLRSNVVKYSFTTDSTWVWDVPQKNGWTKVLGICWNGVHNNSARIVYMRVNDTTGVLGYYYYINSVSPQQNLSYKGVLDTITIGNKYQGRVGWENGFMFVEMNDKHNSIKTDDFFKGLRMLCKPYIGGTYTINHDWTTTITY